MPNLNRVMLMGNLTRDVDLRYTPNNTAVAQISLAINHKYKTGDGEQKEEVVFVDCEAWGRTAEVLNQYLRKGRPVYLEGRLKLDQWQDKEGNNRSKLKVVVESFQFIDGKDQGEQKPALQQSQRPPASRQAPPAEPFVPVDSDNIPF
jgi:single-strand DNA-binding protein